MPGIAPDPRRRDDAWPRSLTDERVLANGAAASADDAMDVSLASGGRADLRLEPALLVKGVEATNVGLVREARVVDLVASTAVNFLAAAAAAAVARFCSNLSLCF